jgi:hypothetical protein
MTGKYFHTKENGDKEEIPKLRFAMIITKTNIPEFFKIFLLILNQVSPTKLNLSLLAIAIVWTAFYIRPNNDRSTPVTSLSHPPAKLTLVNTVLYTAG